MQRGRDPGDLYRGARLTGALEWAGQHSDDLSVPERRFLDASRRRAERNARRLRAVIAGVALLLLASLVAGLIALVQKQHATAEARVALARQLGAQAVNEPRLDLAMLLAREAVNLDRSPQTEGALLATLQRTPAVIGTLALPVKGPPQQLAVTPDGRTLAVGAVNLLRFTLDGPGGGIDSGELRFYDARTHQVKGQRLTDFAGARAPTYSSDGALLAYPTASWPPSIAVRDAHTLRLMHNLALDPLQLASYIPDLAHARTLIAPDGHTIYCAYQDFSLSYDPRATFLARWSLPSGRLLSTTRIDDGAVLAVGLTDAGARVTVVDPRTVTVIDAHRLRRLSWAAITPAPAAPSAAAISPDGHTIAIATHAGAITFIDAASGRRAPRDRPEHRFGGQPRLLTGRSRGREHGKQHSDHMESPIRYVPKGTERPGRPGARGHVQPRRPNPLHIIGRRPCTRMGPGRRAEFRTALRAH